MRRSRTPAQLGRHLVAAVLVVGFLALGWWQIGRAASGNTLSWAYAVQWPVFAAFVAYIWWREVRLAHRDPHAAERLDSPPASGTATEPAVSTPAVRRPVRTARPATPRDDDDPDLASYNRYLAWLNANPGARPGDYPG